MLRPKFEIPWSDPEAPLCDDILIVNRYAVERSGYPIQELRCTSVCLGWIMSNKQIIRGGEGAPSLGGNPVSEEGTENGSVFKARAWALPWLTIFVDDRGTVEHDRPVFMAGGNPIPIQVA